MSPPHLTLDAVTPQGSGVRIAFQQIGDRYGHTIYAVKAGRANAIVQSVDDGDWDGWPLSPPVQEIREVAGADGRRSLLLMGAAASGHWSASISVGEASAEPFLEFDVAVRLSQSPAYLGAAYETTPQAKWIDMPVPGFALAARGEQAISITTQLQGAEDATPTSAALLKTLADPTTPSRRLFLLTERLPKAFPATYRWRYAIALATT